MKGGIGYIKINRPTSNLRNVELDMYVHLDLWRGIRRSYHNTTDDISVENGVVRARVMITRA